MHEQVVTRTPGAAQAGAVVAGQDLLVVTYHYVRDPALYVRPGIHPLALEEFARQVETLKHSFHMATPEELEAYALEGRPLPRRSAFITLDDGLTDHWRAAQEVLEPAGIRAAFFVCTRPLVEGRALMVHKMHWLRASLEPERLRAMLHDALPERWRAAGLTDEQQESARRVYVYDTFEECMLKYLINFVLPEDVVDEASSRMLAALGIDEADFCRETYMDAGALRALQDAGHRIGAHTHDHRWVTRLGAEAAVSLRRHRELLEAVLGRRPNWFSFPVGRGSALPDDIPEFCRTHGFQIGFTLTRQWTDPARMPFAVDRINTNELDEMLACASA